MVVAVTKESVLVGAAGVFHVAAELSLRGMIALPTIRNTAGFDIIATSADGLIHANIQVKTSGQYPTFWPICQKSTSVKHGPDDFYVLLRRHPSRDEFEGYMLTGEEMKKRLEQYESRYPDNKFSLCLCVYPDKELEISNEDIERWQSTWKNWPIE